VCHSVFTNAKKYEYLQVILLDITDIARSSASCFLLIYFLCLFSDSGVHGALVVLEPSFNGDTMATALGIPPSKNIIRRHLATELEALVLPARYVIFCQMEEYQAEVNRAVNNVKQITSR